LSQGLWLRSPIWGEKKQCGAAEAYLTHNPEVDGSKPSSAMQTQYSSTQVGFPNPQSDTRMRSTPGGFQWGTRSQFHTQQLTPFSRSRYYQLQFLKSSLQSNRHQTAESLANPESCKFNELLLSTLKVFPYFTIVIDTSGA